MEGTDLDKLIEQGKTFGFKGKELYNFVETERNRRKEERDAERMWYRQHAEFLMEREKEKSRIRIEEEKERLKLRQCMTQSDDRSVSKVPSRVNDPGRNKLVQPYLEYVRRLGQKIESRRHELEPLDVMHERCKEAECTEPSGVGQKDSTCDANSQFKAKLNVFAAESAVVATQSTEGNSNVDEGLCRQSSANTERPSVIDLAQSPCMFVAMAANSDVRSTTGLTGENPCRDSGSEPCAEAHCEPDNAVAQSSFRGERRSPEEDICSVPKLDELSARLGVNDFSTNHPGCADSMAVEPDEASSALQMMGADFPKESTRKCSKRKRRRTNKRAAKGVKQPKKMRIAKRQTTPRKLRLNFVAFASRARPNALNRPTGGRVRHAPVAQAQIKGNVGRQPSSLPCAVRSAECMDRERLMAGRRDVVGRPVFVKRGVDKGMQPGGELAGNRRRCSYRHVYCVPWYARAASKERPPRARVRVSSF